MPRGKMQHTAALPRGKSWSAYAANAIMSKWKKNFLQTFFRLPKLWNEIGELGVIFFSHWLIPFWNPLFIICRTASFDGTNNLPIKFLGHAASNGMPQPSRRNVHIYLWHGTTFAAWPCCTLPHCAAWHSVEVPWPQHSEAKREISNDKSIAELHPWIIITFSQFSAQPSQDRQYAICHTFIICHLFLSIAMWASIYPPADALLYQSIHSI